MYNVVVYVIVNFFIALLIVAFYTVAESKILAGVQSRIGPGYYSNSWGLLQGIFDGISLLLTSIVVPLYSKPILFVAAPICALVFSYIPWFFLPLMFDNALIGSELSGLFILAFSSMSSIPILIAGYSSNNEYAYLGAFSATCSILSYELLVSIIMVLVFFSCGSYDVLEIILFQNNAGWLVFYMPSIAIIYYILILVETNSAPFDLAESESELVAGFHVEYSGFLFALFFLAEYLNMLLGSVLFSIFFLGGWGYGSYIGDVFFCLNVMFVCSIFIIVSAAFPSFSVDQMILFCWNNLLLYLTMFFIYTFVLLWLYGGVIN